MKKVTLIVTVFILAVFLIQVVTAEKTKIYGIAKPNSQVALLLSYTRDGASVDEQKIVKQSDANGYWTLTINTDPGTIDLELTCAGENKYFEVPAGGEFEANLVEQETPQNEPEDNETNTDGQEDEQNEPEDENNEPEDSSITGKSIFSVGDSNVTSYFYIILALFITIVVANLFSEAVLGIGKKVTGNVRERIKNRDKIKVTKLSERLQKIKEQEEAVNRELESVKNGKKED